MGAGHLGAYCSRALPCRGRGEGLRKDSISRKRLPFQPSIVQLPGLVPEDQLRPGSLYAGRVNPGGSSI